MRHIDREATILQLTEGKRVLHLGCVGHDTSSEREPVPRYEQSMHAQIAAVAAEVVGVDKNADAIAEYERVGLTTKMVVGDVEELEALDLPGPFDVIFSGNVIEHLSHPGRMLDGMRSLSHEGTTIVITTPHAFGISYYARYLLGRFRESADHVMTFNAPSLANLVGRHGFRVATVDTCHQHGGSRRIRLRLVRALFRFFPGLGRTLFLTAEPS